MGDQESRTALPAQLAHSLGGEYVTDKRVFTFAIRAADVIKLARSPEIHKDPFDPILVAQSLSEGIPLRASYLATSDAAPSSNSASRSSTFAARTIWTSASAHRFCSIASLTPGIVFTPYPV